MLVRIQDYLNFGVKYVWVIDPETLESELHTREASVSLTDFTLRIPGTEIVVSLTEVWDA